MKIHWETILTNVISTFFAAIIIGAAALVWKGAMSVDTKVQESEQRQQASDQRQTKTLDYLNKSTKLFESEFIRLNSNQNTIVEEFQAHNEEMENILNTFTEFMNEHRSTLSELESRTDENMFSIEEVREEFQNANARNNASRGGHDLFEDFGEMEDTLSSKKPNIVIKGVGAIGSTVIGVGKGVGKGVGLVGKGVGRVLGVNGNNNSTNSFIAESELSVILSNELEIAIEKLVLSENAKRQTMREAIEKEFEETTVKPHANRAQRFVMPEEQYIQKSLPHLPSF